MLFSLKHNAFLRYLDEINILQYTMICAIVDAMAPFSASSVSADHLSVIKEDTKEWAYKSDS